MRTHYDNLKVSQDAPDFIIRASYKALIQKYHPDKFENKKEKDDAIRITKIIIDAFDVLIDPIKRAEHDKWIVENQNKNFEDDEIIKNPESTRYYEDTLNTEKKQSLYHDEVSDDFVWGAVQLIFVICVVYFLFMKGRDLMDDFMSKSVAPAVLETVHKGADLITEADNLARNEALNPQKSKLQSIEKAFAIPKDSINFEDYPVNEIYHGKTAQALISDPQARYYRTQLREQIKREVEFAGEYVFASWGCGSGCSYGAAVSKRTGKSIFFPYPNFISGATCVGQYHDEDDGHFNFYPNSRLMKVFGSDDIWGGDNHNNLDIRFYEFDGNEFKLIKKFPLKCSESPY